MRTTSRTHAHLTHEPAHGPPGDAEHGDVGELGQATVTRLFSAGLDLHSALGLTSDDRADQRLWHAVGELDEAIIDLRHLMLATLEPPAGAVPGQLSAYDGGMRYAQRGGYTPAEQERRERLRLEAAGWFARGDSVREVARDLRVTEGSVRRWRRAWRGGGAEALRSKGPVSRERLSPQQ